MQPWSPSAESHAGAFGFAVHAYTVTILASTIEDTVCSRQVHRHLLRYAKHLDRITVDHTSLNEEPVIELLYCPHHERLYDATEHRWLSFRRGDVRLIMTIYPRRGDLHVQHTICDVCIRVSLRCFGRQLASS